MKFLLDTVTFIEASRRRGHPRVKAWVNQLVPSQVWLSDMLVAEYLAGLVLRPHGPARNAEFAYLLRGLKLFEFARLRPGVDYAFGRIKAQMKRTVSDNDLWEGALAAFYGLAVATRNVNHFWPQPGVSVFDPWEGRAYAPTS